MADTKPKNPPPNINPPKPAAPASFNNAGKSGSSGGGAAPRSNGGGIIARAAGATSALGQNIQVHGNDLRSTATTWGYTLRDKASGVINKIGETMHPETRYSKKWLDANDLQMFQETSGTKLEMRIWEHENCHPPRDLA